MACKYIFNGVEYKDKQTFIDEFVKPNFINQPKTLRVQEYQSDEFQKLANRFEIFDTQEQGSSGWVYTRVKDNNGKSIYERKRIGIGENHITETITSKEHTAAFDKFLETYHPFLALLHKNDNWITFGIKAIIQNAAKKGYEKVLFPTGNTASKVEGHTTLEEFKKQKEDRIKQKEDEIKELEDYKNNAKIVEQEKGDKYAIKEKTSIFGITNFSRNNKEELNSILEKKINKDVPQEIEKRNKEITQLKQELERVETEGFGALKPIYNFYENTVSNILKKQGYNPVLITDEYENTWNEIIITPKMKDGVIFMNKGTKENNKNNKIQSIINFLSKKFGYKNNVISITREDFFKKFPNKNRDINSAVIGDKIYIFTDANNNIAAEELLHPFIHALYKNNKELFNKLLNNAKEEFPELVEMINYDYKDEPTSVREMEIVTQALSRIFAEDYENKPSKSAILEFFKWLLDTIKEMFGYYNNDNYSDILFEGNPNDVTLRKLSELLNNTDREFNILFQGEFNNKNQNLDDVTLKLIREALLDKDKDLMITKLMNELPGLINNIRYSLDNTKDEKQKRELTNLLSDVKLLRRNEDRLKSQTHTISVVLTILDNLKYKLNEVKSSQLSASEKVMAYHALYKTSNTLESFSDLLLGLNTIIDGIKNKTEQLKDFSRKINQAITTPKTIQLEIASNVISSLKEIIVDYNEPIYNEYKVGIERRIAEFEKEYERLGDSAADIKTKTRITYEIKELKKNLDKLPGKDLIDKIFSGEHNDANIISQWLEAGIVNGHPIINTLMAKLNQVYFEVEQDLLASRNSMQTIIDDISKTHGVSLFNQEDTWKPITDEVKMPVSVTKNDKGELEIKYVTQRALLSSYTFDYIQAYAEFDIKERYYKQEIIKLRELNTNSDEDELKITELALELDKLRKEFNVWKKENSELLNTPAFYENEALLDKVIGKDGDGYDITIRSLKDDLYDEIRKNQLELRGEIISEDTRKSIIQNIRELNIEIRQLKNTVQENGEPKTGTDLEIAMLLTEYSKNKKELGKWTITKEGKEQYDYDLNLLKDSLKRGDIDQNMFDYQKSLMESDVLSQEYIDARNEAYANIASIMEEIIGNPEKNIPGIPELAKVYQNEDKQKIKEYNEKLRNITVDYRDDNFVIDGKFMYETKKDVVKKVKEIQEEIQRLKNINESLFGLSREDNIELTALLRKPVGELTPIDNQRKKELINRKQEIKARNVQHKEILGRLRNAFNYVSEICDRVKTPYYLESRVEQEQLLYDNEEILKDVTDVISTGRFTLNDNVSYYERNDKGLWFEYNRKDPTDLFGGWYAFPLFDKSNPADTGEYKVRNILIKSKAKEKVKESQWWKDNHYTITEWNQSSFDYEEREVPLFIWYKEVPTNKLFISKDQPSLVYKTYVLNETNPNYKEIIPGIAVPKAGKFENPEYLKLKNSKDPKDVSYFNALEKMRIQYRRAQYKIPERNRRGDVLPSVVKTKGENLARFARTLLEGDLKALFESNLEDHDDDDVNILTKGGISRSKMLPVRFVGKMDKSTQSANLPAMILLFELFSAQHDKLNDNLPFVEMLQNTVGKLGVTESKTMATKAKLVNNIKTWFNNKGEVVDVKKETEKSNLSQTFDNFVRMFMFGETSKKSTLNIGGHVFDINKIVGGFTGFTAKSIFIMNYFTAVKNSIATRVQTLIQANINSNVYSEMDFMRANGQLVKYFPQLIRDFRKIGNKSLIGQVLDYFQVIPHNLSGEITSKTEFDLLKEHGTVLGAPKAMSEFEVMVMQFLCFCNSKMIKVNGKSVPLSNFDDIFEKDSSGTIKLKDGVDFSKEEQFRFKMIFDKYTRDIAGAYRQTELSYIETFWLGRSAFFLRKYLVPGITVRYAGSRLSIEEGRVGEGYYHKFWKNLWTTFSVYDGDVTAKWANMSIQEKVYVMKFLKEMLAMLSLVAISFAMGANDEKSELKKNSNLYNFILAEVMAVRTETETFAFEVFAGLDDLIRMYQSPFIIATQLKNIYKLLYLIGPTIAGSDIATYQRDTGLNHKGDLKLWALLFKINGYTGTQFNGVELVKRQQLINTVR